MLFKIPAIAADPSACSRLRAVRGSTSTTAIAASNLFADGIRAELPERARRVCEAVASYASPWWDAEARRVIEQNPVRAMEHVENFPQLKAALRRAPVVGDRDRLPSLRDHVHRRRRSTRRVAEILSCACVRSPGE